jgi:hypothetical protein
LNILTATDETGTARVRIRALDTAANQTAILQVTDLTGGAYQRTTLFLAQASSAVAGFFAVPDTLTFTGDRADHCANSVSGQVFVFGGTPPYTVSNTSTSAFTISPTVLTASGQSFTVSPTGLCVPELAVPVRDAAGRTVTVTLKNQVGTIPVPPVVVPPVIPLTVAPTSVTLTSCTSTASVFVAGGTAPPQVKSNSSVVMANVSGGLITIRRVVPSDATGVTGIVVGVSDGTSIVPVTVTLTGTAAGPC